MQQLFNFKSGLRIEHQQKLKIFFEKINLQNLIDQIISFEKSKALNKLHKRDKHNVRDANVNKKTILKRTKQSVLVKNAKTTIENEVVIMKIVIIIIATNVKNVIVFEAIANEKVIISTMSLLTKKEYKIDLIVYQKRNKTTLRLRTFVLNIRI